MVPKSKAGPPYSENDVHVQLYDVEALTLITISAPDSNSNILGNVCQKGVPNSDIHQFHHCYGMVRNQRNQGPVPATTLARTDTNMRTMRSTLYLSWSH